MRASRPAVPLLVLTFAVGGTVGCSADEGAGPDPDEAAEALAGALAAGDLSALGFDEVTPAGAQASYDEVVDGLGELTPSVAAGEARLGEGDAEGDAEADTATATLTWRWTVVEGIDGGEWTYESEASMTRVDDEWLVDWDPSIVEPSLSTGTVLDLTPIAAERGDVTGARGEALVTARPVVAFGVDRSQVPKRRAVTSARRLAQLVGVDVAPYVDRVRAAGERAFVDALTYRRDDVPGDVGRGWEAIPGVVAVAEERPLAPTREFAAPILGTVGEVTAEMVAEDPALQPGDRAGLSGLQARYDDQLQGAPGAVVDAVASDGKERELFRVEATPGEELALTLDPDLQLEAERLLEDVGPASAIVAVRPSDGAVLAAANGPGTDGYNVATYGQLAPGSTFKTVSTLALLRAGLDADSVVPCAASVTVDGKRFTNYSDYPPTALGRIPLRTAVAHSCNTAFISQRDRLDDGDLAAAAAALGLGVDHDLGFPAYFGSVEPPASETEAAADLIGQGTVLASPMVMATVAASVQRGRLVVPRLVEQVEVSPPDGVEPLTRAEGDALRAMLRGVVSEGSGTALADVPGPPVLAKTGTAEFERDGEVLTHAWMIAAQGDLAVAVFVEIGESGSRTAGPILEAFLRAARATPARRAGG